jgi:hypothetical protein
MDTYMGYYRDHRERQLSAHFRLREFVESKLADEHGIDNGALLIARVADRLAYLATEVLEPVRQKLGFVILVDSGFRCMELNSLVGGVANSQHLQGRAADIVCPDLGPAKTLWAYIKNSELPFDQLILYPGFVHVSLVDEAEAHWPNRRQAFHTPNRGASC